MTGHLIAETASTTGEPQNNQAESATRTAFLAGLVLWAALATAGTVGITPATPYRLRDDEPAESSTAEIVRDPKLLEDVRKIFQAGATEFFEDGTPSNFSRSLMAIVAEHGKRAFAAITDVVYSGAAKPDVISEALRWLSDFDDSSTLPQRWSILQRTLRDNSPKIRDGAILGFAALDDPRALTLLLATAESEQVPELSRLIQEVVEQLNATHAALVAHR